MMFPQFGSLGALGGGGNPSIHLWGGPQMGQMPAVHPAWGIHPPQFNIGQGGGMPGMSGPPAIHPAWGNQPPMWGGGAVGMQNRPMFNPQFYPAMYQHMMGM